MEFLRRHRVKLIASALITAGIIFTVEKGGLKIVPDSGDFSHVRWSTLVLYVPLFFGLSWFRSVRWRFLLRSIVEVPKTRLFAVTCAGYLAILLLPFRLGELARPYLLRTRPEEIQPGKPVLTMTAATSSIVAERVIDGVFLSVVLAVILLVVPTIQPLPDRVIGLPVSVAHVRIMAFVLLGVFTAALITISIFYFARDFAVRLTRAVIGKVSPRLADKLAEMAGHLADGLHVFRRGRDALGFVVETAAYWLCNALGIWVLAAGCGIVHGDGSAPTFAEACALMGMLGCTILIPGPPGLLGVFQAGVFAGLTMYFPRDVVIGPGAAYAFLLYSTTVVLTILTGVWGVWHEGGARRLRGALDGEVGV
ncbi:MAG TPA: lysylphosphatidylglycerol synthase transmembrane domain-containing protein [Kofleriaceae bacterium]|nr:lysylphosphatidylglycerol synthase transmembrane domain-containing protein [Kofleriaceae bacterium]